METHIKPWVFIGRDSFDQLLDFKWVRVDVFQFIFFFFRLQQQPTTSQPHHRSCSSGTGFELISIRGLMLQVWRRRLNSTLKMTQETVRTLTFQRDMWVTDTWVWHYRNNGWSESSRLVEIVTSQRKKYDKRRVLYTPHVMCKCLCNLLKR